MASNLVTEEQLRDILDLPDGEELKDEITTHSGRWIREGDHYRFIWDITEDDRDG
jgi:hypothetical protein